MEKEYLRIPGFPDYRICRAKDGAAEGGPVAGMTVESRKTGVWRPLDNKRPRYVLRRPGSTRLCRVSRERLLYAAERGFDPFGLPGNVEIRVYRGRLEAAVCDKANKKFNTKNLQK